MSRRGALRVCLAASAGGHLDQLLRMKQAWDQYRAFLVTTVGKAEEVERRTGLRTYVVGESNREHPLRVLRVLGGCVGVMMRERPEVVVSTGAAHGCLLALLGKLMGARVVWVDSIANVERASLSGRIVRYVADVFLVQWPGVARQWRRAEYVGELV
jgi:UDP-N-acetylglucosamine:LPS N-acetylglucosamine transferase